jgi:glycosyltransferase involved in cell wall biosynthesis
VLVSASASEGLPNVVGEAMAAGVPCVVTDVGDSARVVGDTGIVVPPDDPAALARGMLGIAKLAATERGALGAAARDRVTARYSVDAMVSDMAAALCREVTPRPCFRPDQARPGT